MKTKSKLRRTKVSSNKTQRVTKPKKSLKAVNNSTGVLRRSIRLSERRLQIHFSLPESDDSENEADDGALDELQELSDCEDNEVENDSISDCGEYEDDGNISDGSMEDVEHSKAAKCSKDGGPDWGCDTEYFDKLDKTFGDSPAIIGDIGQSESHCFGSIFDDQVVSILVTETNRYAKQNDSKNWIDVTPDEMKAFIGCLIVMGIHQLPALKNYWSTDPFLHVEAVANVMTANRFKKIVENLHCNDNETQPPKSDPKFDKLHKVKPLLDVLNENVRKVYKPSGVVTVDESMIPFKGRYTLKQYMPNKPVKWGYKVWCLCDSYTGFVVAFFIYTGKEDSPKNMTLGEKVVTKLVEAAKIERGSLFVMDNFFSSCSLFENLMKDEKFACGTVKGNSKGLPEFMRKNKKTEKGMARGEFHSKNETA